jgi:hypothetical protein
VRKQQKVIERMVKRKLLPIRKKYLYQIHGHIKGVLYEKTAGLLGTVTYFKKRALDFLVP